jgi:hypothetical protein
MKKIFTILVSVLLTASVIAQSPEKMSYQAVIRNSSNALVTNSTIGMQISILQGSASGTTVYTETQTPTTNANGLVSIEIGSGAGFSTIDWSNDIYFIKTETDTAGGTSYTIIGISQLLSVPYALYAKTAETVIGGITETDPVYTTSQASNITTGDITNLSNLSNINTGDQDLSGIAINTQAIQDTAAQIRAEVDGDVTNEIQTLSIAGNDLSITNGNTITIPSSGSLWTDNSGDIYRNGGNVGIGTTNPTSELHVKALNSTDDALKLQINSTGNGQTGILFQGWSDNFSLSAIRSFDVGDYNGDLRFYTDNDDSKNSNLQERVRITEDGNVGIGITDPKSKLQVEGSIQVAGDTGVASADKVGAIRYSSDSNNSYVEMCMQTGASSYSWIIIKQNTW